MKAYQIMMFLLIFNLSISLISVIPITDSNGQVTYGIFKIGVDTSEEYDVTNYDAAVGAAENSLVVWRFLGATIAGIVAGAIAGAIFSLATRVPADAGVAYSVFAGTFWGIAYSALAIFWDIGAIETGSGTATHPAIMMLVFIFTGILAIVFVVGLLQLIRGGWGSYV